MTEEEYRAWVRRRGGAGADSELGIRNSELGVTGPHPALRATFPRGEGLGRDAGAPRRAPTGDLEDVDADGRTRNKYGNRRVCVDGMKFDSVHEANVYGELMMRVRAGELRCVLRQVSFDLPGGIRYVADFVAIAPDMRIEGVYDAKSEITKKNRVYINKKKQMLACHGIEITEV